MKPLRCWLIVVFITSGIFLTFSGNPLRFVFPEDTTGIDEAPRATRKMFAFLLQSKVLPSNAPAGFASRPDVDVFYAIWGKEANATTPLPPTVRGAAYVPGATFSEGRNAALRLALDATQTMEAPGYEYYVFADEDVPKMIACTGRKCSIAESWDIWTDFLLKERPAVGYVSHYYFQVVDEGNVTTGKIRLDANLNAFHRQTIGLALPYDTNLDAASPYYAQIAVSALCATVYFGDCVGSNLLELNMKHNVHTATYRGTDKDINAVASKGVHKQIRSTYYPTSTRNGKLAAGHAYMEKVFMMGHDPKVRGVRCRPRTYAATDDWIRAELNPLHPRTRFLVLWRHAHRDLLKFANPEHMEPGFYAVSAPQAECQGNDTMA